MYIIHRRRGGRQRLVQGVDNEEEKKINTSIIQEEDKVNKDEDNDMVDKQ